MKLSFLYSIILPYIPYYVKRNIAFILKFPSCNPLPSGIKSASGAGRWGCKGYKIALRNFWLSICSADGFGFYNDCSHTNILTGEESLPYAVASFKKPKSRWSRMAGYRQRWRFFAEKYDLCLDYREVGTDGMPL